ncbi:50S ribosomal protein L4 [Mycoplasmopsis lipofaciens]|uniref:50S ribosomal protein L4 n=1 Tax=Mycoplasmopsis lipofaciens TaxID=114884 RepID=UPI0004891C8E|nr:50S ribosomal protein L4 [Mycoplasmopsis lipofaciens]
MADTKKTKLSVANDAKEVKKTSTAKKTAAAKSTKTKKSTTANSTSKAEAKAQETKKTRATKKIAAEIKSEKAKSATQEVKNKAAVAAKAKAEIDEVKKAAAATKRTAKTITSTDTKLSNVKIKGAKRATNEKFTKVIILDFDNKKLPKELFSSEKIYEQAIFDTIMSERASRRQGTHDVKNRAEVRGGGKKPWRQKGTGRARAGSTRSPIWVGGGRAFGPTPERNYTLKVNKKVKKAAFISALTILSNNHSVVIDDFKLAKISTQAAAKKLISLKIQNLKHILIVTNDEIVYKSVNNLPNVICVKPNSVLVEQLIWADALVLSNEGLKIFEGRIK